MIEKNLLSEKPLWDGDFVDAHQHFWDPNVNYHPWLSKDSLIPFRYGDYSPIKRRYLPDDYQKEAKGFNVRETVYVETEWDPSDSVGEVRYATALNHTYGLPSAIVAQAWLDAPNAEEILRQQAGFPLVRSIRHKPKTIEKKSAAGGLMTQMSDERWRRGYAMLESLGLHFDLQVSWRFIEEAICLAKDFPKTLIILNHTGLPENRCEDVLKGWHAAMSKLAECPNVMVKISGLGILGESWKIEKNDWIVKETIKMYGAERCMFASNFPVDRLCGTFADIIQGFKKIASVFDKETQALLFCNTARKIYRTSADTCENAGV